MQRLINKIVGDRNQQQIKKYQPFIAQINAFDAEWDALSDEQIQAKTTEFKERLASGEQVDDLLVEAFATVKQACKRLCGKTMDIKGQTLTRNMIPYDVQLLGGIILHKSHIAEMRTGEGKTLVATLPAYLNALSGKGVHVVTVNDYLASRDAEWMGYLYTWLGLTVGVVTKQTPQGAGRSAAYEQDITYVENSELGFDYLRDNLTVKRSERTVTKRPLHFAIIDEVDSILIDEARTPMIISQASGEPTEKYTYYAQLVTLLTPSKGKKKVNKGFLKELLDDVKKAEEEQAESGDYRVDEKTKSVTLSTEGIKKLEQMLKVENLYRDLGYQEIHHIENALRAKAVYTNNKEYIIKSGEVMLVDDHTGRVMPGRRYSEGLHQAIEAKEKVTIQRESKTLATITYQHFFKLYDKLSGMTGTAMTEAEEFEKIYNLSVLQVPTHKPIIRVDKNDMVYFNQNAKRKAVVEHIKFYHMIGLPILIGTSSIETSELVSGILTKIALPHTVLNAKYHEQEANIVMNAGKSGSVVVATNMAGRGTDIKLEEGLIPKIAKKYASWAYTTATGSDPKVVAMTVYSTEEFEHLTDTLIETMQIDTEQFESGYSTWATNQTVSWKVQFNTKKKNKEDAHATIYLKNTDKKEGDLDEKDIHFGLFILGTEKHDSRRIDNQLRGRSGRQGDPGVSQFFVGMDDEIMRKMGGDKIQSIARLMLSTEELENLAFTQSQFTNAIQRAQKQMEGWHFGIRKHLFDYDSVIDKQRTRMYAKRDQISKIADEEELPSDVVELTVIDEVQEFVIEIVDNLIATYTAASPWMYAELAEECSQISGASILETELSEFSRQQALKEYLIQMFYNQLEQRIPDANDPTTIDLCKRIYLSVIDKHRVQHIDEMHYLREKVSLYGYAQIDPLVIYKKEAFEKFQRLLFTIKKETLAQVLRFDFAAQKNATELAEKIATESNGQINMVEILKQVTEGIVLTTGKPSSPSPKKPTSAVSTTGSGPAKTVSSGDGVEVIELEDGAEQPSSHTPARKDGKLRPNDKVNVKHADGKLEYGVKRKKVKDDVEAGKSTLI